MANKPRIAIVGFVLESNGHAPVVGRDDFIRFSGQEILDDLRRDAPGVRRNFPGSSTG